MSILNKWNVYNIYQDECILFSVFDGVGCEIHCRNENMAFQLSSRLNAEKICGNTILPEWVKEYQ